MIAYIKFTVLLMLLFSNFATAQTNIGAKAGFNFSNVVWRETATKYNTKFNTGLHAGFTVTSPIKFRKQALYIQPGLLFSTKGFRIRYNDEIGETYFVTHPYYFEVPLNILYFIPNRSDKNVFIAGGPYVALAIGGYWETNYKPYGRKVGNLKFMDNSNYLRLWKQYSNGDDFTYSKKLDYGLNFLVGYELNGLLQVMVNGQLGMKNTAPKYDNKPSRESFKNIATSVSLGYIL